MATYSSLLAWRISWTEEPGYSPWDRKELDTTKQLTVSLHFWHLSVLACCMSKMNLVQ